MSNDEPSIPLPGDGSSHTLPDDVDNWPETPADVLGIAETASRKDAKRAYTRLIKRFKPEHFPEQFRRVREAYDQIERFLHWKEELASQGITIRMTDDTGGVIVPAEDDPANTQGPGDSVAVRSADSQSPAGTSGAKPIAMTTGADDRTDQLWQLAIDGGDVESTYRGLARHAAQGTASEMDFARLYWLATLYPDVVDPQHSPLTWLIDGMHQSGRPGRLLGLYANELQRHPEAIRDQRSIALLDAMSRQGRLVDLARIRWSAARKLGEFAIIADDLQRVRQRTFDDLDAWCALLLGAMHQSALTTQAMATELYQQSEQELRVLLNGDPSHWLWDAFESLKSQHDDWQAKLRVFGDIACPLRNFVELIARTWSSGRGEARSAIIEHCREAAIASPHGLQHWNLLAASYRPLLRRFVELLYEQRESERSEPEELTPAAQEELKRWVRQAALQFGELTQNGVLEFCLIEAFTTDDIANAIDEIVDELPPEAAELAELLRRDLAIRAAIEAHRLLS